MNRANTNRAPPDRQQAQSLQVKKRDGKTNKEGERIMKHIGTKLSMLVLAGSLAGTAMAANDGILLKEQANNNYCHMKFPAMRQRTLGSANPELKRDRKSVV